jgi:hypothetical protein
MSPAHLREQFADLDGRRRLPLIVLMENVKTIRSAHFRKHAAD